jgi:hypothetical protein
MGLWLQGQIDALLAAIPAPISAWERRFPDIKGVREIYKREHIWAKVKRQLEEEGKLKPK